MYLTQHTDYGLRVLIYAAVNDDSLVNIGTIAEAYNISKSHLMKVVTALVKGGFLTSIRGKGGGLRLADTPDKINVGAVVRHLEPMQVVECMGENNECLITPSCRLTGILGGAIKACSINQPTICYTNPKSKSLSKKQTINRHSLPTLPICFKRLN